MSALTAVTVLSGLLTVAMQATEAASKLSAMMEKAKEEDRDLTPEELGEFVAARRDAEDAWDNRN